MMHNSAMPRPARHAGATGSQPAAKKPGTAASTTGRSRSSTAKSSERDVRQSTGSAKAVSIKGPTTSAKSRSIPPKPKNGQTSQSQNDLSQTMPLQSSTQAPKSPIKGILKKPKPPGQATGTEDGAKAVPQSDDEQIRRINFQHTLQMMRKERASGYFPEQAEEGKGAAIPEQDPKNLGISLLRASVQNRTGDASHGPDPLEQQEVVLNALPSTKPPDPDQKPINYKHLDWAFREFMKIQEEMIAKGHIDAAIQNLEEALNERLAIYPAKDDGVWKITQLLADVSIKTAVRQLNNNNLDQGLTYLKQARKFTEPLPNSDWSENPDWINLRKSVFKNLALYHQKNEDWNKALDYFKISLKLDTSEKSPDPVGAANTSLTCAVILSKLNRYSDSIDYAQSCMKTLEEIAGIDNAVPLAQYKQNLTKEGAKANGGKMDDQDKIMTSYSICLHLLGKNLANLKYFKESRVFLQRAHYVASHLTVTPKSELVTAINNDLQSINQNFKRALGDTSKMGDNSKGALVDETESALQTIKTNIANSSYSLAADFQEQKALVSQLLEQEQKKKEEDQKLDDKALEYVKKYIEDKKAKEKVEIDEYRTKIQKDFDQKQKEFMEKQKQMKDRKIALEKKNDAKLGPKPKVPPATTKAADAKQTNRSDKPGTSHSGRQGAASVDSARQNAPPVKQPINRNLVKTPNVNEQNAKPGDFEGVEKQTRIKKSEVNLAAEGAKLDNMNLKYSKEKGDKNFLQKRRVNIEKVNENLGFFGGGIMDMPENKDVVIEGGGASQANIEGADEEEFEGNPYEDANETVASKKAGSPTKPPKGAPVLKAPDGSAVKLPPVKGYKLDQLGLSEAGETIMKKSMDHSEAIGSGGATGHSSYKNPHTRKLIHNLDNKDYGKAKRGMTKNMFGKDSPEKKEEDKSPPPPPAKGKAPIRDIPTYQPPASASTDWREEFKKADQSDEELPDTKKLIDKLNVQGAQDLQTTIGLEDEKRVEDSIGEMNDDDVAHLKRQVEEQEAKLAELQAKLNKPPKATAKKDPKHGTPGSQQSSSRLPQIAKRFREDSKGSSPDKSSTGKGAQAGQRAATSLPPPVRDSQQIASQETTKKKVVDILSDTDKSVVGAQGAVGSKKKLAGTSDANSGKGKEEAKKDEEKKSDSANATYLTPAQRKQKKKEEAEAKLAEEKAKLKEKITKTKKQDDAKPKKVNIDRLAELAQPKPVKTATSSHKDSEEDKEKERGEEKAKQMIDKVQRGKQVDLMSYLDRDVPAMNDKVKRKLGGPLPEFSKEGEDNMSEGRSGSRRSRKGAGGDSVSGKNASGKDGESDAGTTKRDGQTLKDGLENRGGGLTLKGLREIENKAAIKIQKVVKGYFTKKWYLNYVTRRKLGVPFSGLEFAENPFLRQFNWPNQRLHSEILAPPQLLEIVNSQAEQKNMLKKQFRHGGQSKSEIRPSEVRDLRGMQSEYESGAGEEDEDRSPKPAHKPMRLKKGTTPQQVMDNLQREFVAKGLDAYSQFKSMGVDALTDDNGNPVFKKNETSKTAELAITSGTDKDDGEKGLSKMSPRKITKALDPMERMIPRWRGDKAQQFLEVKEVAQYLDRVSRMREYDEKQKEALKNQQYQDMARQMKKHQVSTIASFAKAQGVFNREPNQRNQEEDDEDFDPLQIRSPRPFMPGGGGGGSSGDDPPGGGGGGGGGSGSSPDGGGSSKKSKKKKEIQGLREVPFTEDDGTIPLKMYQEFSREIIVFYKGINGIPIKWMIHAGIPFEKNKAFFIPIKIFGEPLHSRNTIISYLMNLELMRISSDFYQYNTHSFETIWPFILYLFNSWVRHQVSLMKLTKDKPLFGKDEFMAPVLAEQPPSPKTLQKEVNAQAGIFHENDYTVNKDIMGDELEINKGVENARELYDDMLNFSSEIEYDERFEYEQYKTLVRPEVLLDRSAPKDKRKSAVELFKSKKKQLFQAYRMQLQEERKVLLNDEDKKRGNAELKLIHGSKGLNQHFLEQKQFGNVFDDDQEGDKDKYSDSDEEDENGKPKKKVKLKLDDIYEPITVRDANPFAFFLRMHFVPLPNNQTSQYKLLKRLQAKSYYEREKSNIILPRDTLNLMNEERRKRLGLLPLTVIDYNCIDRAALKLKIILDCLYPRRQLNGWTLVPRDVREAYIDSEWARRKEKLLKVISKLEDFSLELKKAFGQHIVYAKQYNEQALMIERSIQKINDYKQRKMLRIPTQQKENMFEASNGVMDQRNLFPGAKALPPSASKGGKGSRNQSAMSPAKLGEPEASATKMGESTSKTLGEQAILMSTGRSDKKLGDTTTVVAEKSEDPMAGMVEAGRNDMRKSQFGGGMVGSEIGTRFNHSLKIPGDKTPDPPPEYNDMDEYHEIAGFNQGHREPEVQDYIRDGDIFDQGIIRIRGNLFMATLLFKRIESNYENMKLLMEDRLKEHAPKSQSHQVEMLKNYKGHLRLRSRLCEFVSTDPTVIEFDGKEYGKIAPHEKKVMESEMITKEKTKYKTYMEIKVTTKMSDTIWDDSLNLSWEMIQHFYRKFGIKWRLNDLLLRRQLLFRDRFTIFNFIGPCLSIVDTKLIYNPDQFDFESFKYNHIFLQLDRIRAHRRQFPQMPFYYDDYLRLWNFDETEYDKEVSPFYDMDKAMERKKQEYEKGKVEGSKFEPAEMRPNFEKELAMLAGIEWNAYDEIEDAYQTQSVEVDRYEGDRRKAPELLIDEATKNFLLDNPDQNTMFNLTLRNYHQQQDAIYLGRVPLGYEEAYRNYYNLRIDFYRAGFIPVVQVKAFNSIHAEAFEMKVHHNKTIKSFIRICNLSQEAMIRNQLQSSITIGKKVTGRYMRLNFNKKGLYLSSGIGSLHGQDFINMAICNENLIRTMLNDSYRQYSGVIYFDNLRGKNLVTVSEFEIDMFQTAKDHKSMIHMNKHLTMEQINDLIKKDAKDKASNSTEGVTPPKKYSKVKLWKVNLFNIENSKTYETVITHEDLINYYETDLIILGQIQLKKPDLIILLQDYLRTLYIYRSKVGNLMYWRLPMYKRPIDPKTGLAIEVPPDQIYRLKQLDLYHQLQKKIDGLNKNDDMAQIVPVSMEQLKAKRNRREPPSLSLRPKLVCEKELPVYNLNQALQVLKVTSSIIEVLLQRPKYFKRPGSLKPIFANITVLLHPMMECWIWQIYFPSNQRTFTATFYPSDLFNMNSDIFGGNQPGNKKKSKDRSSNLWITLITKCDLARNQTGDLTLAIDTFKEPLKEILFQDHVYNSNAQDIFFMEVVIKTHNNFVLDVGTAFSPIENFTSKVNEYQVHIRAFSLTRNIWIKDHMPLAEVMQILRKENYFLDNIRLLYYSMIKDASILLSHKIVFSGEAKTTEIKKRTLTYDMRSVTESKEELEKIKKQHLQETKMQQRKKVGLYARADEVGLRTENRNQIDQNKIFYQSVISKSPTQLCTIIYSEVKELFIYRLYRASDQSSYEKRIPAAEVARTCAPHYHQMLLNRMFTQLGERVAKYYMKDMLVASLMSYFKQKQDEQMQVAEQRRKIKQIKVLPGGKIDYPEGYKQIK